MDREQFQRFNRVNEGEISSRHQAPLKTHRRRLPQPEVNLADCADLPGKAQFSQKNCTRGQWAVAKAAKDGRENSQIGTGLVYLQSSGGIYIDVAPHHGNSESLLQHGYQDGDSIVIDSSGCPASGTVLGGNYQRLYLDQDRT